MKTGLRQLLIGLFLGTVVWAAPSGGEAPAPESDANGCDGVPEPYYFYDYINKPYPLYPEPIWRQMFPGIYARIEAEKRAFGVPGQSAKELDYHIRAWRLQRARSLQQARPSK